jgi:AraC-like DNA-binding protein
MAELRVGCVGGTPRDIARVRDALRDLGTVVPLASVTEARRGASAVQADVTLLVVDVAGFDGMLAGVRQLRDARPGHAIVAWCDARGLGSRRLLDLAQAGVTELVLRDVDDLRHGFARILAGAASRSLAEGVREAMLPEIPGALRAMFRFGIDHAHETLDVQGVAAAFGVTRRTLRNRLAQNGYPPPRVFLTWCRLLVASALLDQPGQTLVRVAHLMDFPNGHALSTLLRRYLGLGIIELRRRGVAETTREAFRAAVRATAAAAPDAGRTATSPGCAPPPTDLVSWFDSLPRPTSAR